jgi:putative ABC transport system permease protein
MACFTLWLSAVLVTNMITAFLSQQIRQIAVMKAIGARWYQVMGMYFGTLVLFGTTALVLAFPLGFLAGRLNADFIAYMLNFNIQSYRVPHPVFLLQILIGLGIPLLAAAYPIYKGTQLTVREALTDQGVKQNALGENAFDRFLAGLSGLARPLLLSIRNTFRQRGRLLLTFATLTVGGAIFMVALNVRASLLNTIDVRYAGLHYDLSLSFDQPYPIDELEATATSIPGVVQAEAWGRSTAALVKADGTVDEAFILIAPPPEITLITPAVIDGQWLSPENGIVLNHNLLAEYPDLQVGDEITSAA